MSAKRTIANLLASAGEPPLPDRLGKTRQARRKLWVMETMVKIRETQEQVDQAWSRRLDELEAAGIDPDEDQDFPPLPEEEQLDVLLAEVKAVCDHDRWPRALHWGGM